MRILFSFLAIAVGVAIASPSMSYAANSPEQAFVDQYKQAFEKKDEAALKALLLSKNANAEALEFFTMMMTAEMGTPIKSIELRDLTPEEVKKATETQPLPGGGMAKLPINPTKKLVIKMGDEHSNSSSETFVAMVDGKYMIPVPADVKTEKK